MPNEFNIGQFAKPFDIGAQKAEGQELISQFGAAIPRIRGEIESQLGLPGLRETQRGLGEAITGVTGQIRAVPGVVEGTTRESLVTESQRGRLVAKQQEKPREQLARLAESQATIGAQLGATEALASQRTQENLLPFQVGFSLLEQRQAREASNYQFSQQQELNRLISNQQSGIQLSEGEKNRMANLAVRELEFKNNLERIEKTARTPTFAELPFDLANISNFEQLLAIFSGGS